MLDKNVTKYCYMNQEKYKASYRQSMSNGQIFFDINVTAGTKEELKSESDEAIQICIDVCNKFNKQIVKKEKKPKPSKKEKEPTNVKGLK